MKKALVSLYHDTRRILDNNRYPVKLRVYYGRTKMYETGISATKEEFEHGYVEQAPRGRFKKIQTMLKAIESKAIEAADDLRFFSFEKFERALFRDRGSINNVIAHYCEYISELEGQERIGTASNYRCSMNSILQFANIDRTHVVERISFDTINLDFLHRYERWMTGKEKSRSTVGIYLRPLRKLFNSAIANGDIPPELYPFKKYRIPNGRNIKKTIEKDVLKTLYTYQTDDEFIIKARDYWFFSYQCNGMNFRDIAELRFKNLSDDYFTFLRQKTLHTTGQDPAPIVVPITPSVARFIAKYGRKNGDDRDYIFPIFEHGMDAKEKHRTNQNFIRFVNQHMRRLTKMVGINFNIGTMYARHSFTTMAAREAGLEFAQEALGHTTLLTTQKYWAGFEKKVKHEVAEKLLDFIT
ncbi:tyrosine-type recombinase/integrase [Pedobacter sp. LMG 31464]|uniref:Tyrosine-type recombinase/integrase n=1 Tax=Pedobacter planticolens TaxID=2679964 RepID=A0A923IW80_9SPHI|nr:site-specific integrase [Pedobacter planticolens]MBB2146836.1 tyrosine-type recombinase/integrase [Pedobacter planticolens]